MGRLVTLMYLVFLVDHSMLQISLNVFDYINCPCDRRADLDVSKTIISYHNCETHSNASYMINYAGDAILKRRDFDKRQCVHILIPGFATTDKSFVSNVATCTLCRVPCNNGKKPIVLVIDHSKYLNGLLIQKLNIIEVYKKAVTFVKPIGKRLAYFVVKLLEQIEGSHINFLGHSLGAQVMGYMGSYVKQFTGRSLPVLYAADPAGPCYKSCPAEHINSNNAELVISFHSNYGQFGTTLNLSHYDMYAYNGVAQRECYLNSLINIPSLTKSLCSHNLCVPIAYTPFTNGRGWLAKKCSSATEYLSGECDNNESTYAGYKLRPNSSYGVYFFKPGKLSCVNIYRDYLSAGLSFINFEKITDFL